MHPSSGEGLPDACGVVPDCAGARLPYAAKVRLSSPVAIFEINYVDMIDVASSDSALDEFFSSSGYVNPTQSSPDPLEDDNNNLDLFDDVNEDDSASPSFFDSSCDDPGTKALHALDPTLCAIGQNDDNSAAQSFFESSYDAVLFPAAVPCPAMSDMDPMTACTDALAPGTKALHALDLKLCAIGLTCFAFYGQLWTDVSTVATCAHADGESMALDPGTQALHVLDLKLRAIGQTRSAFYGQLRTDVPTDPDALPVAVFDINYVDMSDVALSDPKDLDSWTAFLDRPPHPSCQRCPC